MQPVTMRPSQRGVRKPLPAGSFVMAPEGQASVTSATLECGIEPSSAAAAGVLSTSSRRGHVPGGCHHHAVSNDRPACCVKLVAVLDPPEGRDRCPGSEFCAPVLQVGHERVDHMAEAAADPKEERLRLRAGAWDRPRGVARQRSQCPRHTAVSNECPCHLGCHDDKRELVEATGVDTAEQRVHEALDELPAEPCFEDRGPLDSGPPGFLASAALVPVWPAT